MIHDPVSRLSDGVLSSELRASFVDERADTVRQLKLIAEYDARKLYLPAAYPSMRAFVMGEFGLWEQGAAKRVYAARTAYRFPAIYDFIADGRLHLSAVVMLASQLTPENAAELLVAAAQRSKSDIERLLAQRSPRPDLPARVEPSPGVPGLDQHSPGNVESSAPAATEGSVPRPRVAPLAHERYGVQFTIGQADFDLLRRVQEMLSHQAAANDVGKVFVRALHLMATQLEERKYAATSRPRDGGRRSSRNSRHIPAEVKRAVRERDGDRCTFVSDTGRRCESRERLEFDHVEPFARGGPATVAGIRQRCQAHNQYAAEQVFGAEFMRQKREQARHQKAAPSTTPASPREDDVVPWLLELGFRAAEARRAAEYCDRQGPATLEQRVRTALRFLTPAHRLPRAPVPVA